MVKKLLAEYVWDITQLEDNPFTFLDVQTTLEGSTVGGYRTEDYNQVLNQHRAIRVLIDSLDNDQDRLSKALAKKFHAQVARDEALAWGEFRHGQVGISGTSHQPPDYEDLDALFDDGLSQLQTMSDPVEQALAYFLWASMNQFFYDGNKRTARLMMNYILMSNGYYYLSVPADRKEAFNQVMVDFYDSKQADAAMAFMLSCYKNWD